MGKNLARLFLVIILFIAQPSFGATYSVLNYGAIPNDGIDDTNAFFRH